MNPQSTIFMTLETLQQEQEQRKKITKPKGVKKYIDVNCTYCGETFQAWESKIKLANKEFNGHLYCSRECSRQNQHKFYDDFYYCDFCRCWIRQNTAIWLEKKTKKRTQTIPTCPKMSCNNNKLKTKSTNYKPKQQQQQDAEK